MNLKFLVKKVSNKYLVLVILILILSISIGYSYLNSVLNINGKFTARVDLDTRITKVTMVEATNGATEIESNFTKDSTTMNIFLPNDSSSIKYKVTITNKSGGNIIVEDIIQQTESNNISYSLEGIQKEGIISGNTIDFYVTITNKTSIQQTATLDLKYSLFAIPDAYQITYDNSKSGSEYTTLGNSIDDLYTKLS